MRIPSPEFLARYCPLCPVEGVKKIQASQTQDIFTLWEAWNNQCAEDQPVPHWAVVWPAARAMAAWLLDNPQSVRGKTVLEIGCGSGVAAIAAAMAGAQTVTASDNDPAALGMTVINALANRVTVHTSAENFLQADDPGAQIILLADFFYKKEESEALVSRLKAWHRQGISILIADGGRPFTPLGMLNTVWHGKAAADPLLDNSYEKEVTIGWFKPE